VPLAAAVVFLPVGAAPVDQVVEVVGLVVLVEVANYLLFY